MNLILCFLWWCCCWCFCILTKKKIIIGYDEENFHGFMCAYGTTNDEDAPYSHFPLVLFPLWASDTKKCPGLLKKYFFFPLRPPSFTYLYSILWIHVFLFFILIGKPHQAITDVPASSPIPPNILCIYPLFVQFFSYISFLACQHSFHVMFYYFFFFLYLPSTPHSFCHRRCLSFLVCLPQTRKKISFFFFVCECVACHVWR